MRRYFGSTVNQLIGMGLFDAPRLDEKTQELVNTALNNARQNGYDYSTSDPEMVATDLPHYVPAQLATARATAERRARMSAPLRAEASIETDAVPVRTGAPPLNLRPGVRTNKLSVREVQRAVCFYLGTRLEDMLRETQKPVHTAPRMLAMYIARETTGGSWNFLGQQFARDHTSVLNGWRRVEAAIRNDPLYAKAVREIMESLT